MYAQVINGIVNLIGGAEVGLPLPQHCLEENKNVLNIKISEKDDVQEGYYYDMETGEFSDKPPEPDNIIE